MEIQVYFKTSMFEGKEIENEQTGYAILLAKWLCSVLPSNLESDFLDEDWGCFISLTDNYHKKIELTCGQVEDNEFSICINTKQGLIDRLLKRDPFIGDANHIQSIIKKTLDSSSDLTDVEWAKNG